MTDFEANVRERNGAAVIELRGRIDGDADQSLADAYERAAALGPSTILLNFQDVGYINSTGIALIVGLLARARKTQLPVLASGLSEHYRHIFQITRIADFMSFYPDEDTAVASGPAAKA